MIMWLDPFVVSTPIVPNKFGRSVGFAETCRTNELRKGRSSEARGLQERKDRPFYRIGADCTEEVRQE